MDSDVTAYGHYAPINGQQASFGISGAMLPSVRYQLRQPTQVSAPRSSAPSTRGSHRHRRSNSSR